MWLGCVTVECRTFDCEVVGSISGRDSIKWLLLEWVTVCGQVNHFGITNTKVNSAFHLFVVGKSSTGLSDGVKAGRVQLC